MPRDSKIPPHDVKFAVTAAYESFAHRWSMHSEKEYWVGVMSSLLTPFSIDAINAATDFCLKEFQRPPVPVELLELTKRAHDGKPLSESIVSKVERMAYLILASEEFGTSDIRESELADACLIAAAIAHTKSYTKLLPETDAESIENLFAERAKMFGAEATEWKSQAASSKGYWANFFQSPQREA